jgi:hypothetical protein
MGSKTIFHQLESDKTLDEVKMATQKSLMMMGGTVQPRGDGFQLLQANTGINFAFTADFDTFVSIRESKPGKFEILVNANWKPNVLFWICLIVGFFIFGILWIVPILYFFIDPTSAYQQALFTINNFLN